MPRSPAGNDWAVIDQNVTASCAKEQEEDNDS